MCISAKKCPEQRMRSRISAIQAYKTDTQLGPDAEARSRRRRVLSGLVRLTKWLCKLTQMGIWGARESVARGNLQPQNQKNPFDGAASIRIAYQPTLVSKLVRDWSVVYTCHTMQIGREAPISCQLLEGPVPRGVSTLASATWLCVACVGRLIAGGFVSFDPSPRVFSKSLKRTWDPATMESRARIPQLGTHLVMRKVKRSLATNATGVFLRGET